MNRFSVKVSSDRRALTIVFESDTPLEVASPQEIEAKLSLLNAGFLLEEKPASPLNQAWTRLHRLAEKLGFTK